MKVFQYFILIFFIVFQCNVLFAQVSAEAKVDKSNVIVGDPIQYSIQIKNSQNNKIHLPKFADSIGKFEILELAKIDTVQKNILQRITLTAWDSGSFYIPAQRIILINNSHSDSLFTDSILINVNTVPVDTSKPFKDIKPNIKVGYTSAEIALYIFLALLALAVIAGLVYYFFIRKKSVKAQVLDEDLNLLPHELALKRLERLKAKDLLLEAKYKEHYTELTDIIRHYLDTQFLMQTMESTSDEIVQEAKQMKIAPEVRNKMRNLFETADLVKFAKILPTPFDNEETFNAAQFIVNKTKPKEIINPSDNKK